MARRRRIDRERVKALVFNNKTDKEIADILNAAESTIKDIRCKELKILKRDDIYFGKKWRTGSWRLDNRMRHAFIAIPLKFMKYIGFEPGMKYEFQIKPVLPNKILLEMRRKPHEALL